MARRIPIPAVVIPVVAFALYFLLPGVREQPWTPVRWLGAAVAIAGYVFVTIARIQLGNSFTVLPQARELVTRGLYSRLRNPLYVFVDIMFCGFILVLRLYWLFAIVPIIVAAQSVQAHREAKVLRAKFGEQYDRYRQQTWF